MSGSQTGIADIPKRIAQQAAECPNEKFALVGYSQGGMVVSGALSKIPAKYQDKVVAIVLYGAGDGSGVAKSYYNKALANCAPGDFVSYQLVLGYKAPILTNLSGLSKIWIRSRTRVVQ
jgi:pimeloyl-ACP methyl ester carboxylesterase